MRQVLKANEVQFEAPMQLDLDPGPKSSARGPQPACAAPSMPAQARIAESHAEYALVEVTCSCGQTTYVRCEYEPAQV